VVSKSNHLGSEYGYKTHSEYFKLPISHAPLPISIELSTRWAEAVN
jgi:hypothetical protein